MSVNMTLERRRRQHAFWEGMADRYPKPFSAKSLADTNLVIGLAAARGVTIDRAEILDVGCGTGIYSLPLARQASRVVGLDFSEGMLARFERERQAHGISNASALRASWKVADISELGLEKQFDIAWAAMTPAIRDTADLVRMNRCAREWCVYIGWGSFRRNALMEEIFRAHGLSFCPPPGAAAVQTLLKKQGIYAELDQVCTSWDWQGSEAEAVEHAVGFIEAQSDCTADRQTIAKIVARYSENGQVSHRTAAEKGVLVWRP